MPPRMTTAKTMPNHSNGVDGVKALLSARQHAGDGGGGAGEAGEQHAEPAVVDAERGGDRAVLGERPQRPADVRAPQHEDGAPARTTAAANASSVGTGNTKSPMRTDSVA